MEKFGNIAKIVSNHDQRGGFYFEIKTGSDELVKLDVPERYVSDVVKGNVWPQEGNLVKILEVAKNKTMFFVVWDHDKCNKQWNDTMNTELTTKKATRKRVAKAKPSRAKRIMRITGEIVLIRIMIRLIFKAISAIIAVGGIMFTGSMVMPEFNSWAWNAVKTIFSAVIDRFTL
ncbi:hypothetical protein [Vibrio mediterranei]|uniref:hypothetical protein n=1 Tax=Vibrio mediterranei TaxID=689 RepID=UPI004067C0AB